MKENSKYFLDKNPFSPSSVRYAPVGLCFSKFPLYVVTLRLCVLSSTTTYSFLSLLAVASSRFTDNVTLWPLLVASAPASSFSSIGFLSSHCCISLQILTNTARK